MRGTGVVGGQSRTLLPVSRPVRRRVRCEGAAIIGAPFLPARPTVTGGGSRGGVLLDTPRRATVQWAPHRPTGGQVDPAAAVGSQKTGAGPPVRGPSLPGQPAAGRVGRSPRTGSPAAALARGGAVSRFPPFLWTRGRALRHHRRRRTVGDGLEAGVVCHLRRPEGRVTPSLWPAGQRQGAPLSGRRGGGPGSPPGWPSGSPFGCWPWPAVRWRCGLCHHGGWRQGPWTPPRPRMRGDRLYGSWGRTSWRFPPRSHLAILVFQKSHSHQNNFRLHTATGGRDGPYRCSRG